ncbi:MAG: hypothetical protein WBG46_08030 [Nonlabens sp.]
MLKSKKSLYILIPLTLIIWGTVVYKVYKGLNPDLPELEQFDASRFRESENQNETLVKLKEPEMDPFLGTSYKKEPIVPKKSKVVKQEPFQWPRVIYLGTVAEKKNKQKVAAVEINGIRQTVERGDVVDSLKIVSIGKEDLKIQYKGRLKGFKKN